MPEKKIREIVNFIKNFLEHHHVRTSKIILFGSYAKREPSQESDMDIAIISKDFEKKDIFERARMIKGLQWSLVESFSLPFDIVPLSPTEWRASSSLVINFIRQGREF